MSGSPSPDVIAEQARALLDERVQVVRALAERRSTTEQVRAELADAERADAAAYSAAQRAGWSERELRDMGLAPATKVRRIRSSRPRAAAQISGNVIGSVDE